MYRYAWLVLATGMGCPSLTFADIDRVYHPYVEQNEREIEYTSVWRDINNENILLQRAGIGYAWNQHWFGEIYFLSDYVTHEGTQVKGYEAEIKWQVTEQGEYWADWGLLFEVGSANDIDRRELAAGFLMEMEITPKWVNTLNLITEYEFGNDINDELEMSLREQLRYRFSPTIEPAVELYLDDQDWAMGPALKGIQKITAGKKIQWELGWLFGLDSTTPENSLRMGIEFEF